MVLVGLTFKLRFLNLSVILVLVLVVLQRCLALVYTDQFVIYVKGGRNVSEKLAEKYGYTYIGEIFDGYYHLRHNKVSKRSTKATREESRKLSEESEVKWFSQQVLLEREKREVQSRFALKDLFFNDPLWPNMWYLNRGTGKDMNIKRVWEQGFTGRGVVVTILDDGIEKDHPDMFENFDPEASYDLIGEDWDPEPRYDKQNTNKHGTRCAGVVAGASNNSHCAVGVAFGVSIGGVRILDGQVTDAIEAKALTFNMKHIDIYSSSWGPSDNGLIVEGPKPLAQKAFKMAIEKGRNGLGSIFVWASGNGGPYHDNCNCDGYASSMWTISISGATENDGIPWYAEECSSTLATTYSSGSEQERKIVTIDLHHQCTLNHTGTSAAAPMAAGIIALTLEANPTLTWRDIQHLMIRTSNRRKLVADDWQTNGVGRHISHFYGYGLMDAAAMVDLGQEWVTVAKQEKCVARLENGESIIPTKSQLTFSLSVQCEEINYLEHVQSVITISALRRGDLKIDLTSPMGTKSKLLTIRPFDNSTAGFHLWPFMSVHFWEESPKGVWKLDIYNDNDESDAVLKDWKLVMFGTEFSPD